jgi:hypothetical protein
MHYNRFYNLVYYGAIAVFVAGVIPHLFVTVYIWLPKWIWVTGTGVWMTLGYFNELADLRSELKSSDGWRTESLEIFAFRFKLHKRQAEALLFLEAVGVLTICILVIRHTHGLIPASYR